VRDCLCSRTRRLRKSEWDLAASSCGSWEKEGACASSVRAITEQVRGTMPGLESREAPWPVAAWDTHDPAVACGKKEFLDGAAGKCCCVNGLAFTPTAHLLSGK